MLTPSRMPARSVTTSAGRTTPPILPRPPRPWSPTRAPPSSTWAPPPERSPPWPPSASRARARSTSTATSPTTFPPNSCPTRVTRSGRTCTPGMPRPNARARAKGSASRFPTTRPKPSRRARELPSRNSSSAKPPRLPFAPNAPSDSSPSFAPRRSARAASDTPKSSNARCCVRRLTTRSRRDARRRGQPRRAPRTRPRVSRGRRCATRSSRCSSPRGHPRNPRGRESSRTDRPERPGACWTPRRRRDCDDWRFEDSGIGTGTGIGTGIGTGTGTRCVPGIRSTRWFATRAER